MFAKSLIAAGVLLAGLSATAGAKAAEAQQAAPIVVAQAVRVEVGSPRAHRRTVVRRTVVERRGPRVRRTTVIRHDRGLHRGWRHAPAYGARRTTVVKKRGPLGRTKTTIIREN